MGDGKPKYLNSPETKIFDKSRNLYGLHLARSSRRKNLIICEGYMDVISMHQAGFNNAVASLGTALTSLQAGLMKRYTDEVLVIYDSDEAGVKAALRAIPMLKGVGLTTRVVNLRPYKDPDEFIQHEGCEAFEKRLEEAENSVLYEIRMKERDFDLADPQGKSDFLHEAVRRLVAIEDEIERNSYLEAVAGKYGIAVEVLRKQVGQMALSGAGRTERVKPRNTAANKKEKEGGVEKAQKLMLTWMTSYPALIGKLEKYITPEDFTTPLYRQIAEMIVLQYHEGGVNPAKLLNQFVDSEEQKEVAGLFNARIPLETEEEKRRALRQERQTISRETEDLSVWEDRIAALCDERQSLQKSCTLADRTMELLNLAKDRLANRYVADVERGFTRYAKELLGENLGRALLDKNLCLFIDEQGAAREAASFSAGTLDALTLCMRLALVDALFTKEQPFLLLDDPFVNLDDARTKRALELLQKISQQRQVVYLVCNSARV